MRLKYYLRGIGIGIIGTTILFMILISIHRNDNAQGSDAPAKLSDEGSKTVAQLQEGTQESLTEMESSEIDSPESTEPKEDTAAAKAAQQNGAKPEDKPPVPQGNPADQALDNQEPAVQPEGTEAPVQPEEKEEEKVRIEISGGQYSDVVCKKLQEAGLVDSAKDFNDYLVQKKYDNGILPGVYEIPKGATYEEIAVLLTTKIR